MVYHFSCFVWLVGVGLFVLLNECIRLSLLFLSCVSSVCFVCLCACVFFFVDVFWACMFYFHSLTVIDLLRKRYLNGKKTRKLQEIEISTQARQSARLSVVVQLELTSSETLIPGKL